MVTSGADLPLAAGADHVARAILVRAKERTAMMHPFFLARLQRVEGRVRPLRIARDGSRGSKLRIVIRPVPIAAPLPRVSGQIIEPVAVRRELRNGRQADGTVLTRVIGRELPLECARHDPAAGPKVISPDVKLSRDTAPRRKFPLGLGWEAFAGPLCVRSCITISDVHHGIFSPTFEVAVGALRMTPAR